ncbi:aldehyde dehydrogenase family protein [Paracoccus pacificus]|uniref:Aldehyde dehydrogenase family protein n=1 Tax=Paracoccus pacificus TaxID=1463598 RepID=A0ABW4R914_9RHOB
MNSIAKIMETMEYGPSVEDSGAVREWLAGHPRWGHFIGGKFTKPGKGFDTIDPATGEVLAHISQGTVGDVTAAVRAARRAQPGWAKLSGHERARFIYAIARTIQKRERFLSVLETMDNGKPIRESRDIDIPLVVRHFYHHAGWAELRDSEFPDHAPLGVCGQIIPWNFPLLMLAWKIAPALAAGNTVVLKPAEYTPLTALAFAEICAAVGLPAGVVNIVTGDGETGAALVDAKVDKIAFTGSTEVGRAIRAATAGSGKRLTLELGGKSPFVVMPDADLDAAVEGVVDSIWFNQGQVCCAGSRILVAEQVADAFETRLRHRLSHLRMGPPLDKSTDIGAIVHPVQKARIEAIVAEGIAAGAELVGGETGDGCFIAPGYLKNITPANPAMAQEIFGPIATLSSFRNADEAVELANNTRYGLAASVWSESAAVATDIAAQIRAGVVWVNCANLFDAAAPFGGMRESGFGREGGRVGMLDYLAPPPVKPAKAADAGRLSAMPHEGASAGGIGIDRTPKLYIGGAQKRPDGGASYEVKGGLVPFGNRKDIRNAVEAAAKSVKWAGMGGHGRAQVLYYIAENLSARAEDFARLTSKPEVDAAIRRCFHYAAQADKFDGRAVHAKAGHVTLVLPEPWGVMGVICPEEAPLAGFLSLVLPAIAMGNNVVALPSQQGALAVTELYQVFDTSDLPGGVVNIVTGPHADLAKTLAQHDEVAAIWSTPAQRRLVEAENVGNLKATWTPAPRDWLGPQAQGVEFLDHAVQWKTVWQPYGALPDGGAGAKY